MARSIRDSVLENRTNRLKLAKRGKPYAGPSLNRGVRQDYRRTKIGNGSWIARVADGHGNYPIRVIAQADDFDESNGKTILNFFEAQEAIRQLGSGSAVQGTLDSALTEWRADLITASSNPYNADWPRAHLTPELLAKPIVLLTAPELKKWRDSLFGIKSIGTLNRLGVCIRAALNFAARQDPRIKNQSAWETGLANLPNPEAAHNVVLEDDKVHELVTTAYEMDYQFGLYMDAAASTGARSSQLRRLLIEDLRMHPTRPTLMMPKSGKGGRRKGRAERRTQHYSFPISPELAVKLQVATRGRNSDEPLLLRSDGTTWPDKLGGSFLRRMRRLITLIGLDPTEVTMYALRHSSIVRMLLKNVPTRVVAELHNTSIGMIETHYSKHIADYSDDISRAALLRPMSPSRDNVVKLAVPSKQTRRIRSSQA